MKRILPLFFASLIFWNACTEPEITTFGSISGAVVDVVSKEAIYGVKVTLSPGGLSQLTGKDGTFSFEELDTQEYTLSFTKDGYDSETQKVRVKANYSSNVQVSLNPIQPLLSVSARVLNFGKDLSTLAIDISNSGKGILKWKVDESVAWIECSSYDGETEKGISTIVVNANRSVLEQGNYSESFVISSNGGSETIIVSISVNGIKLKVEPAELDFGSLINSKQMLLENTGSGILKYSVVSTRDWLTMTKTSGAVSTVDNITAVVSREGLSAGHYDADVIFSTDGGEVSVPVKMDVAINEKPTVTVESISDISYNSAVLHGTIVSVGSEKVTKYGFCWDVSETPTIDDNYSNLGDCSMTEAFESFVTNLTPDTKYFVRAYAESNVGLSYSGKIVSFTTGGLPTLPGVSSGNVEEITSSSAKAKGALTSLGNVSKIIRYGHVWGTSSKPSIENGQYSDLGEASSTSSFMSEITGLSPYTNYYIRAYAVNEKGTAYGNDIVFVTAKADAMVLTSDVTDVVHNAATCGGKITDYGGHTITEMGVCWSTAAMPVFADNHAVATTKKDNSFVCRLSGLKKETVYYVRAYVKTSDNIIFYGDDQKFVTTKEVKLPVLSNVSVTNIQTNSATFVGAIASDGNSEITECGFCWSDVAEPTIDDNKVNCDPQSSEMGKNITSLSEDSKYFVRSFARNAMGYSYSELVSFETKAVTKPEVSAVMVENIGRTTAYVSASIVSTGNADVNEVGFCWALSPNPTVYDNKMSCEVSEMFKGKLTGLPVQTTVYVRAYAINSKGTGYGNDVSFTTIDTDIDVWDGVSVATSFGGGMGTESDPIIINSAAQLKLLADNVNKGTTYFDVYFTLDVNINLNNHKWSPIGSSSHPFQGSFNGNNHLISGIYINSPNVMEQGLFGYINAGNYISDLYVNGTIIGNEKIGGLCGVAYNYKTISNCHSNCNVQGNSDVGGLIGYVECDTKMTFTLINCSNQGNISGVKSNVGGLIGYSKCCGYNSGRYANIKIVNVLNKGDIIANSYAGGVVGYLYSMGGTYYGTSYTVLENCVNYSEVNSSSCGGIIGCAYYSTTADEKLTLNNIYWLYDISNNWGMEQGFGYILPRSGSSALTSSCIYFLRSDKSCKLKNGSDLNDKLNQWVDDNPDYSDLKYWKYEIIDGYACPGFE